MGRLSCQPFFTLISMNVFTSFDLVRHYLTRPLHIQFTRPHIPLWFGVFPPNSLQLEDTDHPITQSLQGLAIGAATLFFVILLLSLTASLQEQVNNHIVQPQLDPWVTPLDEQC